MKSAKVTDIAVARELRKFPNLPVPKGSLQVVVHGITPKLAMHWISECNTHNRPIRQAAVDEYAADMSAGAWKLHLDGIQFDRTGTFLVDGQHRLWAIIESGVTVKMAISWGTELDAQLVIDSGVTRNSRDFLMLDDTLDCGEVKAGQPGVLKAILRGANPANLRMSHTVEAEKFKLHHDAVVFAEKCFPTKRPRITTNGVMGVVGRAFYSKHSNDVIARFCEVLYYGQATTKKGEATAIVLRDWLMRGANGRCHRAADIYAKTQSALLAFVEGRNLKQIIGRSDELFLLPTESKGYRRQVGAKTKKTRETKVGRIFRLVSDGKRPVTYQEVAKRLSITPDASRHALDRCVRLGWLQKSRGKGKAPALYSPK